MLTKLYPALIQFAEHELRARGFTDQEAADVVQDACRRWTEVTATEDGARSFMRNTIRGRIANLRRSGRDAMSHQPISLDQIEEV